MKIKYSCKIREPGQFFVGDLVVPNNTLSKGIFKEEPRKILAIIESANNRTRLKLSGTDLQPATCVFDLFKPKL